MNVTLECIESCHLQAILWISHLTHLNALNHENCNQFKAWRVDRLERLIGWQQSSDTLFKHVIPLYVCQTVELHLMSCRIGRWVHKWDVLLPSYEHNRAYLWIPSPRNSQSYSTRIKTIRWKMKMHRDIFLKSYQLRVDRTWVDRTWVDKTWVDRTSSRHLKLTTDIDADCEQAQMKPNAWHNIICNTGYSECNMRSQKCLASAFQIGTCHTPEQIA